jgi:hypothetical protein
MKKISIFQIIISLLNLWILFLKLNIFINFINSFFLPLNLFLENKLNFDFLHSFLLLKLKYSFKLNLDFLDYRICFLILFNCFHLLAFFIIFLFNFNYFYNKNFFFLLILSIYNLFWFFFKFNFLPLFANQKKKIIFFFFFFPF